MTHHKEEPSGRNPRTMTQPPAKRPINTMSSDSIPKETYIWFAVVMILLTITVAGNLLTMFAIRLSRKIASLVSNQFVFSLALSDLLVGLAMPYHFAFSVGLNLSSNKVTCIFRFVLVIFACSSSILNLLVIATDRYVAIVHPLEYSKYMRRKVAYSIVVAGWASTFVFATVVLYWNNWREEINCTFSEIVPQDYVSFVLTPMFISVWLVIILVYIRIWRVAAKHAKKIRNAACCHSYSTNDWKSIQVVLLILGCFSVCWLPYFITITCMKIVGDLPVVYEISFTLAMANSCMNPLIYAWKNSNFRDAFLAMLRCKSPNGNPQPHEYVTNHTPTISNKDLKQEQAKDIALEMDKVTTLDRDGHWRLEEQIDYSTLPR